MEREKATINGVIFRLKSRQMLKRLLCELRAEGYSNDFVREIIDIHHPFLRDNANTLIHWPVPVRMTRKEIREEEARIRLEEDDSQADG